MSDKPTIAEHSRRYRLAVERAAKSGGIDSLPKGQRAEFDDAVRELGLDAATTDNDVALWRGHLAVIDSTEKAAASLATHRPLGEIDADIGTAKEVLAAKLAEIVVDLRRLFDERCGRVAAEKRVVHAESRRFTPPELSWAFMSLSKPVPSIQNLGRVMACVDEVLQ